MDPRVQSGAVALQQQFALSKRVYDAAVSLHEVLPRLNEALDRAQSSGNAGLAEKVGALLGAGGGGGGGRGRGGTEGQPTVAKRIRRRAQAACLDAGWKRPSPAQTVRTAEDALARYQALMAQVKAMLLPHEPGNGKCQHLCGNWTD